MICLFVILVISPFWFQRNVLVLIVPGTGHCLPFPSNVINLIFLGGGGGVQPIKIISLTLSRVSYQVGKNDMSRVTRKPTFWFLTWSDTNKAVQPQKMARGLKFWI